MYSLAYLSLGVFARNRRAAPKTWNAKSLHPPPPPLYFFFTYPIYTAKIRACIKGAVKLIVYGQSERDFSNVSAPYTIYLLVARASRAPVYTAHGEQLKRRYSRVV